MELGKILFLIWTNTVPSSATTVWLGIRKDKNKPEKHAIKQVKKSV